MNNGKLKKVNMRLPPLLYAQIKRMAQTQGRYMEALFAELLREALAARTKKGAA